MQQALFHYEVPQHCSSICCSPCCSEILGRILVDNLYWTKYTIPTSLKNWDSKTWSNNGYNEKSIRIDQVDGQRISTKLLKPIFSIFY